MRQAKVTLVDFDGLCSADMYPLRSFIDRKYLQQFMLAEVFVRQSVSEDNRRGLDPMSGDDE